MQFSSTLDGDGPLRAEEVVEGGLDEEVPAGGGKAVIVGNAGKYCVEEPQSRNLLSKLLIELPGNVNIKYLGAAGQKAPQPGSAPEAEFSTHRQQTPDILNWAQIKHPITAIQPNGKLDTGFECRLRREDEKTVYAGVYRRFVRVPGTRWYEQLMHIDVNREKWGEAQTTVQLTDLKPGRYELTQIHRQQQSLGIITVEPEGVLQWQTDKAVTGQLQIFKVRKID